ncbi:transcription termination/antitermination protein NusG [[Mycoplasma] testudinis]|uniref:transcription termination/antitermination protein NusG n=1 Tax=[Mycoplasma] testudinis TaxID=33924 RepID=UPI0006977706|nr:transcription termination/antitermination protein NusG [[Mycoplasma] testudinis]
MEKTKKTTSKKSKIKNPAQWYITTCSNGNEDTVIKNLKAKIVALNFQDKVLDAKVIKSRTTVEEIFNDADPEHTPPKNMRNTANVKWKTLGEGKYLKVKIVDKNKFPGYIYVQMIMADDTWYVVRNAPNITGLVGSSGKGAKPIPIRFEEEMLLSGESEDPNIRVLMLDNAIIEMDREKFDEHGNLIGFEPPHIEKTNATQDDDLANQKVTAAKKTKNSKSKKEDVIVSEPEQVEEAEEDEISVLNPTSLKVHVDTNQSSDEIQTASSEIEDLLSQTMDEQKVDESTQPEVTFEMSNSDIIQIQQSEAKLSEAQPEDKEEFIPFKPEQENASEPENITAEIPPMINVVESPSQQEVESEDTTEQSETSTSLNQEIKKDEIDG